MNRFRIKSLIFVLIMSVAMPVFGDYDVNQLTPIQRRFWDWIKITDRRQTASEVQLQLLVKHVGDLGLSPCHLSSWMTEFGEATAKNETAIQFLEDKITQLRETVSSVEITLLETLGRTRRTTSSQVLDEVHLLAQRIAVNEAAIKEHSEVMQRIINEVLPAVHQDLRSQRSLQKTDSQALRQALTSYEERLQTFCERLANHEQRISQIEQVTYKRPFPDPRFTPDVHLQFNPVYFALERSRICDNAQLMKRDHVHTQVENGQTMVYFGDMYIACDGREVLVKTRAPYRL